MYSRPCKSEMKVKGKQVIVCGCGYSVWVLYMIVNVCEKPASVQNKRKTKGMPLDFKGSK